MKDSSRKEDDDINVIMLQVKIPYLLSLDLGQGEKTTRDICVFEGFLFDT